MLKNIFFMIISLFISFASSDDESYTISQNQNEIPHHQEAETQTKVNVTVFYESLCPASIEFVVTQLEPAATALDKYLNVKLIPYGNAKTNETSKGQYHFKCQHGPDECFGNKLQACACDHLGNTTAAVVFNACVLKYTKKRGQGVDFATALLRCGRIHTVSPNDIWQCAISEHASILLKNYGIETERMYRKYVPYVLINNSANKEDEAIDDLLKVLCQMIQPTPKACVKGQQSVIFLK